MISIKLLAGFLLVVSAYLSWWAVSAGSFFWLLPSGISIVASVGLLLSKSWAQYLWHVMALVVSLWWVVSVVRVALHGGHDDSAVAWVISLIPGLFLITICAGGSAVVAKHYRGKKSAL